MEENEISDEEIDVQDDTSMENVKRLKTEDVQGSEEQKYEEAGTSSASNETEVSNGETSFPKCTNSRNRNYRKQENNNEEREESSQEFDSQEMETTETSPQGLQSQIAYLDFEFHNENDSSNEERSNVSLSDKNSDTESEAEDPPVLSKEKPKHKWHMVPELLNRELGMSARFKMPELFQQRCYGSLHSVQRLELMYKMDKHNGCVNSLNFHPNGELLASGSDDLSCVIWDWPTGKDLIKFETKHRGNVFQSKFLPLSGDLHIVTCARDGQVRLHQVSKTEGLRSSRKLGSHKGPTHKLALLKDQPHVILSAGEDGCVFNHDVRAPKAVKLLTVQTFEDHKVPLYSINSHPLKSHEFCVSGRDHLVRIYDQRKLHHVMSTFFPGHIKKKADMINLHVTCAIYNYNGTEILASYNDDDIYLFDCSKTTNAYIHSYQGHRNGATIKGVNFFGPKSEYIVSGSDCGNLYFWDKNTESIVQWMLADDNGVVNCLEPHPSLPIIATSGLDCDLKLWVPSNEQEPKMEGLGATVRKNIRCRTAERHRESETDVNDSQMLWMLWRHLRTTERLQPENFAAGLDPESSSVADITQSASSSSSSDDSDSSEADEDFDRTMTCSPS